MAKENIKLSVDKTDLTVGDEIVVSASVPEGLDSYALIATLKYDNNVFQKIGESDFLASESETITYNALNSKFGIINKTGKIAEEGVLFSVRLKVKEDANVGNTNIALTNISSSDGSNTESFEKATVKVFVSRDAKDGEAIPTNKENIIEEDEALLIKTFSNIPLIGTFAIIALVIFGVLIYMYVLKRNKVESKKPLYCLLVIEGLLLVVIGAFLITNCSKKDVNDDGVKDYNDAEEIIKYLIDIEGSNDNITEESNKDNQVNSNSSSNKKPSSSNNNNKKPETKPDSDYDTNNDGKVDVEDVGHITEDVTENTKVILTIDDEAENYYVNKGEITLQFKATITPSSVKIVKVKIDDSYYDVIYNDGLYSVKLQTPKQAGKYEFKITEVELDNGKKVKTSLKIEKEILKDVPYVNEFNLNDEEKELSFTLVDNDSAFIDGTASIYEGATLIAEAKVEKNKTTIKFDGSLDKEYIVEIIGSYDLDSETFDNKNNYDDIVMFNESFSLGGDYNFTLTDISITDALQPGEVPVISFTSTNNRNAIIANANLTIIGEEAKNYNITKRDGNNYEVRLDEADISIGKHKVSLNNVGLSSLKTFYNTEDYNANELTYTVLKAAPTVDNITSECDKETKNIKVKFKLKDENLATEKLTVVLVDSERKMVAKKEIKREELDSNIDLSVDLSYANSFDGYYTIYVLADYQLSDKYTYNNKKLGETSILTHDTDIYIQKIYVTNNSNADINNLYPVKNQKDYQLIFEVYVDDSTLDAIKAKYGTFYSQVSSVTINGLNYPASKTQNYTGGNVYKSKLFLIVPSEAGILDIKANRVQFAIDGYSNMYKTEIYSVKEEKITVDVLKDKPKIDNLVIIDDYDKEQVTFNFDVTLDATETPENFTGEMTLDGQNQPITAGNNQVIFNNITKDQNMDLVFKGTYDLDSDKDNGKNNVTNGELLKVTYGLFNEDTYKDITIVNGKALSKNDNQYFEKNETINLYFDIQNILPALEATPYKVVIDNQEYSIIKNLEGYKLELDGYHTAGEKAITITDIILSNGKKVKLTTPYTFNFEVLKDVASIVDYKYEDLKEKIKVVFKIKDTDNSLIDKAKVKITGENGKVIYDDIYQNEITFAKEKDILRYNVVVTADYDRDIDIRSSSANYHQNITLLDEMISLEENNMEFKDIIDINLYKEINNEEIKLINTVDVSDIENNRDKYFIEIIMKNLPPARVRIKGVVTEDDILTLILDYKYVTLENTNRTQTIRIDFGEIKDGQANNEYHPADAFRVLLEKLEAGEDVTLKRNYDASAYNPDSLTYVTKDYSGHLDGNGYTIENLSKPLFNNITDATIENLVINSVNITSIEVQGIVANTADKVEVKNVLINDIVRQQSPEKSGLLIGWVKNSTIEECRITKFNMSVYGNSQQVGALVGRLENSTVKNNYVSGSLSANWNYIGSFIGDLIGKSFILNNYSKVTYNNWASTVGCSFACSQSTEVIAKNNVDLSTTNGQIQYKFINTMSSESTNNYYLLGANEKVEKNGVIVINSADVDTELFKTKALFDEDIWYLRGTSLNNLPKLVKETKTKLETITDFDQNKEILYKNLMKLAPLYDSEKIVEEGKNIDDELLLNEEIKHIIPFDKDGGIVSYLTTDDAKKIKTIKLIFENDKTKEYNVTYEKTYDMVAAYKIVNLNIDYTYNHYIINSNSQVVVNLTNYLQGLDYTNNLDVLTTNDDSRIYRDFYQETTKNEIKEFVLKYLSNSNYTNTTDDEIINNYIEREVKKDQKIEKALYVYNYYRRFYDLDIDNMKVYDFVLFNMDGFDAGLTFENIVNKYFADSTGANFNTGSTDSTYIKLFSKNTGLAHISSLLEYIVTHLSNYNMDEWTAKQFKGILVEIPVKDHPEIQYTLWDHLSTEDKNAGSSYRVHNYVLPILTLPKTAAYIISAPAQFTIGAQRVYMGNPENPEELAKFKKKMDAYTGRIESYYNTLYSILEDPQLFNDMHLYQLDKRTTKNENGASVYNTPYTTTEPFHKNFDEVVGTWPATQGVNAGNWGSWIEWNVAGFMDSDITTDGTLDTGHPTFMTWSHESAHYFDARLFLKNNGRRFDAGGEDYADAMFMQEFSSVGIVMNLTVNYNKGLEVGTNLNPERINSPAKIQDFYRKMFDTIYIMDYLEAQAFLQLSDEDKAEVGVQVLYPDEHSQFAYNIKKDENGNPILDENNNQIREYYGKTYIEDEYARYRARLSTLYMPLYLMDEQLDYSKLQTIDDLIENRIMLYPGNYKSSRGRDSYGGEGFDVVHWYQTYNPYGRPESYALKWISYEMLGYAGYNDGFVEYASNIHYEPRKTYNSLANPYNEDGTPNFAKNPINFKSDAMALKRITNGEYEDFNEYKKDRFQYVEDNLDHLNKIIDAKEYVQKFYNALVEDGDTMKAAAENAIKSKGTESECMGDYYCIRALWSARGYKKSTEVRKELYYTLKNLTDDFRTDEIYMSTWQQNTDDLQVIK